MKYLIPLIHVLADEPNNSPGSNADCVRLDRSQSYQWRDTHCGDGLDFICEYEHPL